jgi:NAD(P)-dependent dehydrogenase (short-subunit alcohol dehydrogenase family)
MSKLNNKVAVVTGASKGIGAGIAKAFAKEGAKVVVNYSSSKENADNVVKSITENGGVAIVVQGAGCGQQGVERKAPILKLYRAFLWGLCRLLHLVFRHSAFFFNCSILKLFSLWMKSKSPN